MLEPGNQGEESAAAGEQIKLYARPKDPKGPSKTSKFQGVSFNAQNKFWEAYVWDLNKKRDPRKNAVIPKRRKRTGGQWYLGMYDSQEEAAWIHDKVFIKLGRHKELDGTEPCPLNFPLSTYAADIEEMKECGTEPIEEYIRRLRATYSVGFVRGKVDKRGVSDRRTNSGKYVARLCFKDSDTNRKVNIHLGSFEDKVEAGKCYDKAAIFYKTRAVALTNFPEISYTKEEIEAFGRQLEAKRQKTRA